MSQVSNIESTFKIFIENLFFYIQKHNYIYINVMKNTLLLHSSAKHTFTRDILLYGIISFIELKCVTLSYKLTYFFFYIPIKITTY